MKIGKPKSKRTPARLRHKIEKASASKQRKQRKEAKKNPQWQSRLKKDPGIPNLFPYKDKVLAEIEESKRKKEEEQQRKRELARAQREGKRTGAAGPAAEPEDDTDEDLPDVEESGEVDYEDDEDMKEAANPMAALLASAQARAQTFRQDSQKHDEDEVDHGEELDNYGNNKVDAGTSTDAVRKTLPKQALADPIKTVTALLDRLQKTQEGMQQLLAYYQLPPLVTANSDMTTRFLVDVARKRGRLGRGGIPNLNAAALTVLGDLNDERLQLPALDLISQPSRTVSNKGEVRIVSNLAQPFRIEGLFGDLPSGGKAVDMEVET